MRRYFSFENFIDFFKVPIGIFQSYFILRKWKPDIVFSKGGYVSLPVILGARLLKIKIIIHESDVIPGLANKIASRFADIICLSFQESKKYFKKSSSKIEITGNPIRKKLLNGKKEKALEFTNFNTDKPIILVIGGSQGSEQINKLLLKSLNQLLEKFQIIHVCGVGKKWNKNELGKYKINENLLNSFKQIEFAGEELGDLFAVSDLVISRAGANTLAEIALNKKKALIIPLGKDFSRGDQIINADIFAKKTGWEVLKGEIKKEDFVNGILNAYKNEFNEKSDFKNGTDEIIKLFLEKEFAINGRFLNQKFTGIGQWTFNIFKELSKIENSLNDSNKYIFIVPKLPSKDILNAFGKNFSFKIIKEISWFPSGLRKTFWEQVSLPRFIKKQKIKNVIFPYPSNPWCKNFYKKIRKTFVVVHDCITWTDKRYRRGFLSNLYHKKTRKALKKTDQIITVSETSKKEIINMSGLNQDKIKVIYNDAADVFKENFTGKSEEEEVLENLGLKKNNFFLYVGGYDERKNVNYLVKEYLSENFQELLVLAGEKLFKNKLYKSFDDFSDKKIIKTGFLTGEELKVLYQNCLAFVHMSQQEGFNIPIIEASNCGAPLILSDIPIHREIAKENALFVNIKEKNNLKLALEKFKNQNLSEKLSEKSFNLSKFYSWEISAKELKDLLN